MFADFDGYRTVELQRSARVAVEDCTFAGNTLFNYTTNTTNLGSAVIRVPSAELGGQPGVRLERCTFSNNTPSTLPTLLADNRYVEFPEAVFYSDTSTPPVCTYEVESIFAPSCMTSSPLQLLEPGGDIFLNASKAWFVQAKEVRPWFDTCTY